MRPRTATSLAALALAAGIGLAGAAGAAPFFTLAGGVDGPDVGNDFAFINGTGAIIRESQAGNAATINITGPGRHARAVSPGDVVAGENRPVFHAAAGGYARPPPSGRRAAAPRSRPLWCSAVGALTRRGPGSNVPPA